jgi:hypothetical protein
MTREEALFAIISGLLVNEATDISPWLAIRLVRWAARLRYLHAPERAATRGEELAALINDRPGKLFKLFTALGFGLHALVIAGLQASPRVERLMVNAAGFASQQRDIRRVVFWTMARIVAVAGIAAIASLPIRVVTMAIRDSGVSAGVAAMIVVLAVASTTAVAWAGIRTVAVAGRTGVDVVEAGLLAVVGAGVVGVATSLAMAGVVITVWAVAAGWSMGGISGGIVARVAERTRS